ncbi:nucleobase:cation symporter-2, NCS2 family [[Eubacterium] yurii]|jgi:uracil-xanthine permease|nr:nucleobase:cation symporter-2, NCS2 family [[Eubacterium] yurii]
MENSKENNKNLYIYEAPLSMADTAPLAFQHVVAMVVGCITPALIISGGAGLSPEDKVLLVQSSLIFAGLATLLQNFGIFGKLGSKLPVIMGVGFAYVSTLSAIVKNAIGAGFDGPKAMAVVFGAQLVGGIIAMLFGLFVKKLTKFFPPLVTGTVILSIGLGLYPVAVRYMAGGGNIDSNPNFGSLKNWAVALVTLAVVLLCNNFGKGSIKLASILIGVVAGYLVSIPLGMVNFSSIANAGLVQAPKPMHFGFEFIPSAIISLGILHIVNSIQAIGDLTATTEGGMDRLPTDDELQGGIIGYGFSSLVGSVFGCMPLSTFSQNVGIVTLNKCINRKIFVFSSILVIIAGLLPKISAILTTIPQAVLGGATISVFATISMTGVKMVSGAGLNPRNIGVVGIALAIGEGIVRVPGSLTGFPQMVIDVFGTSATSTTTLIAVVLNLILPQVIENKSKKE